MHLRGYIQHLRNRLAQSTDDQWSILQRTFARSAKNIPVVVLTTSHDEQDRKELMSMGARDFFTKPDSVSKWEQMLNQILTTYLS